MMRVIQEKVMAYEKDFLVNRDLIFGKGQTFLLDVKSVDGKVKYNGR